MKYYIDFVVLPIVAIGVAWHARSDWGWGWAGRVLLGLVLFTYLEYWVHRSILHGVFWSSYHQRHHRRPTEYVVFPWWYMPAIFGSAWVVLPAPWFVGFVVGAVWFFGWHHALHHWNLNGPGVARRALRQYSEWHELHHKDLPANYGITHPLWDLLHGTYMTRAEGESEIKARAYIRRRMGWH